jgi:ribosomal-protein-alanine N-acetyltransferase
MTKHVNSRSGANAVYLRRPSASDFDELMRLYSSSKTHLRGLSNPPADRQAFDRWLVSIEPDTTESFLICVKDDDAIAGTIALSQIFRRGFQNAYLGYLLGAAFVGKGYMTEAVGKILRFAFVDLKLHRIEANVQPENLPSIGVFATERVYERGILTQIS